MKKMLFVLIAFCCVSSLAFAEDAAKPVAVANATAGVLVAAPADETASAVTPVAAPVNEVAPAVVPETLTLKGDVIDNMCAGANKDTLAEFVKTHTKECATKPACMDSGYSIFADGKLYAFDKDSSAKVAEFLKTADSKLQVTVTAQQVGDELSLVSIENQ